MNGVSSVTSSLDVRRDFPYLAECVYLNTAAAGVSWRGQGQAAASFYDGPKSRGMNGMADWRARADEARARIARLMHVTSSEVRFAASTTEGLYLALGAVRFMDGDEIVLADDEFPSVVAACEHAPRAAVTLRRVSVPAEASREDVLVNAITSRTRAVALSHVHWVTGTRIDLDRVGAACEHVGATLIIDGAQGVGAVPVSLRANTLYCASVFKWLISGFGLAIVIVRDGAGQSLEPAVRGYSNPSPSRDLLYSHVNHPGIHALDGSLEYLERVGPDRIFAQIDALWTELYTALAALGLEIVTPEAAHAGIISCRLPNAVEIKDRLARDDVYVEERSGLLRVSPHFYNTSEDVSAFNEQLHRALRR